jgi:hypothetical protein
MCPVRLRYFWTSQKFMVRMVVVGLSWPSTVPCCRAMKTSEKARGTAVAPRALNVSMFTLEACTRNLSPTMSAGLLTGRLLFVMCAVPMRVLPRYLKPFVSIFLQMALATSLAQNLR